MTVLQNTATIVRSFIRPKTPAALRRAVDTALHAFAESHPEMVDALFDGPFLHGKGAPFVARLARSERPESSDLVAAWIAQWGFDPAAATRHAADAEGAIESFVQLLEVELRQQASARRPSRVLRSTIGLHSR